MPFFTINNNMNLTFTFIINSFKIPYNQYMSMHTKVDNWDNF